jgi:hypothetical protein
MAKLTSREAYKQYCLRNLGSPVIDVNVDDEQLEDRIDEALQYYRDYHYDGTIHDYVKHQITAEDITNQYITIGEHIQGIVRVFDIDDTGVGASSLFNVRYQIHLNDLYQFSSATYAPYVSAMTNIATMEEIFVGKQPIDFNRHVNRLYIRMDWDDIVVGEFIIIEVYRTTDPDTYTDVWNDRWLLRYGTALFKRQWGENLSKFAGVQLPGGITLDGPRIMSEAREEIQKLEEEMISSYSLPVHDMTG